MIIVIVIQLHPLDLLWESSERCLSTALISSGAQMAIETEMLGCP